MFYDMFRCAISDIFYQETQDFIKSKVMHFDCFIVFKRVKSYYIIYKFLTIGLPVGKVGYVVTDFKNDLKTWSYKKEDAIEQLNNLILQSDI